jgi:hypothetical protein
MYGQEPTGKMLNEEPLGLSGRESDVDIIGSVVDPVCKIGPARVEALQSLLLS